MCGLVQSIFATVPVTVTGWLPSYSAANEWCADGCAAHNAAPQRTRRRCLIASRILQYAARDAGGTGGTGGRDGRDGQEGQDGQERRDGRDDEYVAIAGGADHDSGGAGGDGTGDAAGDDV